MAQLDLLSMEIYVKNRREKGSGGSEGLGAGTSKMGKFEVIHLYHTILDWMYYLSTRFVSNTSTSTRTSSNFHLYRVYVKRQSKQEKKRKEKTERTKERKKR